MDLKEELEGLLAANVPLINLITYEELRVIETLKSLDAAKDLGLATWDLADCRFTAIRDGKQPLGDKEFTTDTLLPFIAEKAPDGQVFVLKDFHHSWDQKKAFITRKLRNMAPQLRKKNQFLVMITPDACLPKELKDDVVVLQVPLPDLKELTARFDQLTRNLGRGALPKPAVKDKLVTSALGLTTNQAQLAFSRVWARFRKFDERGIDLVTWAKRDVIRDSGALEFWPAEEGEADVGGLDLMKDYLRGREKTFTPEAVAAKCRPAGASCWSAFPAPARACRRRCSPACGSGRCCGWTWAPSSAACWASRRRTCAWPRPSPTPSARVSCGSTRWRKPSPAAAPSRSTPGPPPGCWARSSPGCRSTARR